MNKTNEVPVGSAGHKKGDVKRSKMPPAKSLADLAVDQKDKNPSKFFKSEQHISNDVNDDLKNKKSTPETKTPVHEKQKGNKEKNKSKTDLNNKSKDKVAQIQDILSSASPKAKLQEKNQSEINIAVPNIFVTTASQVDLDSNGEELETLLNEDKSFSGIKIESNGEEKKDLKISENKLSMDNKKDVKFSNYYLLEYDKSSIQFITDKISLESAKPSSYTNCAHSKSMFSEVNTEDFDMSHETLSKVYASQIVNKKGESEPFLIKVKDNGNKNYKLPPEIEHSEVHVKRENLGTEKICLESAKPSSYTNCGHSKSKFSEVNTEVFDMSHETLSKLYVSQIVNKKGESEPFLIKVKDNGNKNDKLSPEIEYSEVHVERESLGTSKERLSKVCVSERNNRYYQGHNLDKP